MKNVIRNSSVLLVGALFLLTNCAADKKPADKETVQLSTEQLAQRGEYLVTIMGCHDCHSPKQMGPNGPSLIPELLLSGFPTGAPLPEVDAALISKGMSVFNPDLTASAGPWGISFSANLTSDATGIGNWTEENFKRALKEGKFKGLPGTRTLLPPMPWANYEHISDEDVSAIFAYLKSTPPVKNVVPAPVPPSDLASR
jgi:mono/diheme cytochrome c family protein